MSDKPHWEKQPEGMEALWRGPKGERGETGKAGITRSQVIGYLVIIFIVLFLSASALTLGVRTANSLQKQIHSQCHQDGDVGNLKVTIAPGQTKPGFTLIQLIHDFRAGYRGLGCPEVTGPLNPPDPLYVKWAPHYGYKDTD